MNQREWVRVKEVMWLALEQPADSREEFLQKECGGDLELIAEIKSLIEASEESDQLLENENYNVSSVISKTEEPAKEKTFGNYRIIRELGRGGMGVVFLAERADGEFTQKVALKVIRQSFADARLENRFRRERQILANLNHPNIAALHDGGVSRRDEPFLVMEYVEGEPLLDYAETHELSIEDRLKLFVKICAAISYAHQNLIVHRDIKPGNIIVTKNGEPKLLDFGLAKILDENFDANTTETAFRAFTPSYASPEQIRGSLITTASDVYSLGIVLYELLTGRNPFHFENKSFEEILKTVDHTEPMRPSSAGSGRWSVDGSRLESKDSVSKNNGRTTTPKSKIQNLKSLRGDLDNITLKALRKEPERRYKSVEEFATDIERHLNDLPISARPNNVSYLASRFFRRNKIAVSAVGLIILALAAGLTIALWQANEARKERDRAERRFQDVRKLSNSLLFELSPKIERLQGSTEAREILVERALEYLDSLATESKDDSSLQSELAAAYEKIADLQGNPQKPNLSDYKGAILSYEKAQTIRQHLLEKNPDDFNLRRFQAGNLRAAGDTKWWMNDIKGAQQNHMKSLAIYEELAIERKDSLEIQLALTDTLIDIGKVFSENNKFAEAVPYLQKSLILVKELADKHPENSEAQRMLGESYARLGNCLSWIEQQKEAEFLIDKALAINESLVKNFPNDPIIRHGLWVNYMIASSIYEEINNDLSYNFALKNVKFIEQTVEKDKANIQARQNLAKSYSRLGITLSNLKRMSEGIVYLEKSQSIYEELEKNEPKNLTYKTDLGRLYTRLGDTKQNAGNLKESLADWEKSAELFNQVNQNDSTSIVSQRDLAQVYKNIGNIYQELAGSSNAAANTRLAGENYGKALSILSRLKEQNAFAEFDQPFFEEMKTAAQKYAQINE